MTNTLKHLTLLTRMENSGLKPRLTGKFPEDALDQACGRVETFQLQARLRTGNDNVQIQKELVRTPEFAMLYRALCDHAADDEAITNMLQSAAACGEQLTQYSKELVLAAAVTDLPPSLRFYYMKYYLPFIKYEEEEQAIIDNLNTFPVAEWEELSALTDAQRNMMRRPFLGPYLFNWHDNERTALELLEQNRPLQRVLTLLHRQGVTLALDAKRIKDLRWVEMADVMKFRRLLAAFEYDTEDLDAFFERWLENHAGQYDLNWFISRTPPLDKVQRREILRNDLSYLNALYSGRLHLDFSAIRRHQFPILTYAVQHGKKHFLDLVSEHSELFLSLGRYALLFEDKFCEHCNLNSLTAKNLRACDTVERGSSYFDLLEDGRQYTFEEMWLLWRQDEIYVRLYTMLTPLSVDRRLLTLRQLLKYGLLSRHMEDQELEQLAAEKGNEYLHQMLLNVDPVSAGEIHANNVKRVIRALEFYHQNQSPISAHNQEQKEHETPYNLAYFVLNVPRELLYKRIDDRIDEMLKEGLLEEVQKLKDMGYHRGMVSMQGLGYKEILAYLDGEYPLEEAVRILKRDTRHFAKRQLTWFRREKDTIWMNKDEFDYNEDRILDEMLKVCRDRRIL